MLIRKPNFLDISKACKFLSKDEKVQEDLMLEWLSQFKRNNKFYSLIALENKEVVGVLTGIINLSPTKETLFTLVSVVGTKDIKDHLLAKVVKDINPDYGLYTGSDIDYLKSSGFTVVSTDLVWENPNKNTDEVFNGNR